MKSYETKQQIERAIKMIARIEKIQISSEDVSRGTEDVFIRLLNMAANNELILESAKVAEQEIYDLAQDWLSR